MTRTDKDNISKRTENHLLRGIRAGFTAARATPYKGLLLGLYLAGAVLAWLLRAHLFSLDTYGLFSPVLGAFNSCVRSRGPLGALGADGDTLGRQSGKRGLAESGPC